MGEQHTRGAKNRFGHDDDRNTCPFCGLTSPVWDRDGIDGSEPFECECGAWFYAKMPDVIAFRAPHRLKIWPEYYQAVADWRKTFEIRKGDRDFQVGDDVWLLEWDPEIEQYTGRGVHVRIIYILVGPLAPPDQVIFSFERCGTVV